MTDDASVHPTSITPGVGNHQPHPGPTVPISVWLLLVPLVDPRNTPIMLLSMAMLPQPMLTDTTARERTVIDTLEADDYEAVLAMFRWYAIPPDADAPRIR